MPPAPASTSVVAIAGPAADTGSVHPDPQPAYLQQAPPQPVVWLGRPPPAEPRLSTGAVIALCGLLLLTVLDLAMTAYVFFAVRSLASWF